MNISSKLRLISACLGNLLEHYDNALFGFLSVFLAPLIFPHHDPVTALILTYAMSPLGMLARPIGALVFGVIGDLVGRDFALYVTLMGMGIVSAFMAFSPTFAQVGFWSPVFFCLGRALQNFFAAGETMGGSIYLLENSGTSRKDVLSSIYNMTTIGGYLLASFGVFLIGLYQYTESGWRILYAFGCLTAVLGVFLRKTQIEKSKTVFFHQTLRHIKEAIFLYPKPFLSIVVVSGFGAACASVALVLVNGFIPMITTISKTQMMGINTYLLVFDAILMPVLGFVAFKITREKLMTIASLFVLLFSGPLFSLLQGASFETVVAIRMLLVTVGVAFFAPFHAWATSLIPSHHKGVVVSFAYAFGALIFGSPTAAVSMWCFQTTSMVSSVAWYWMFLAALTSAVLFWSVQTKKNRIAESF